MDTETSEKKTKLKRRGHVAVATVMGNAPSPGVWTRRCCLSSGPCLCPPDQPEDGPQLYVLLCGFYRPLLIAALDAVGVHVSTVIRLCSEDPEGEERCQGDGQPAGEQCDR